LNREPTAFSATKCATFSPQKLRPNCDANGLSATAPAASAAGILFCRHALGVAVVVNPPLHVTIVIIVGRVLNALLGNRGAGIIALRAGRTPISVV
jgi:hypothetical protein